MDSGDIHEVGFRVMEQAIRQQAAWRDIYGELQISFNVSYQQLIVIVDSLLEMCRRLGYHYSRPVCRHDFEKLLDENRR